MSMSYEKSCLIAAGEKFLRWRTSAFGMKVLRTRSSGIYSRMPESFSLTREILQKVHYVVSAK